MISEVNSFRLGSGLVQGLDDLGGRQLPELRRSDEFGLGGACLGETRDARELANMVEEGSRCVSLGELSLADTD